MKIFTPVTKPRFGQAQNQYTRREMLKHLALAGSALALGAPLGASPSKAGGPGQAAAVNQAQNQAVSRFDQLVERYFNDWPNNDEALARYQKQLAQIQADALTPTYQGLYMLFDHHLKKERFYLREGSQLRQLGVNLTRPKTVQEIRLMEHQHYPKPPKRLMEGGIGKRRYEAMLQLENFVNLTTEELTQLARQQYNAIESQMKRVAAQIDPTKDWRDLYRELRKQHPKKEELLDHYRREVERARNFLREKNLISLPQERLNVIETPDFYRRSIPYAAYLPGRGPSGTFMVTTVIDEDPNKVEEQLQAHSYWFIPPVVVHEAFPGHHLQHVHDSYNPVDETNAQNRTLSRILSITPKNIYFVEGWGVYSEEMVRENGYYTKPQEQLFALRNILWRAARAWIDPQIHTGRMTYDQAVNFLVDNVLLERDRAEIEVNRYYQRPTEVPSYLTGMLQIKQLRKQLEQTTKRPLQAKAFHDTLLRGYELPVPVIARMQFNQTLDTP